MSLRIWPALADSQGWWDCKVLCERAIHGKAHLQPTDFRWLARSPRFQPEVLLSAGRLNWGAQDQPMTLSAWVASGRPCYGVRGYVSKARDAAGRSGVIEKQFLVLVESVPRIPPPLLALRVMERIEGWDDSVWWRHWNDPGWSDPDYSRVLPAEEPLRFRTTELVGDLANAVRLLLDTVATPMLERFYAEIFSGLRPAVLGGRGQPLPGRALAALLLPLHADRVSKMSLSAGLPSSQIPLERLPEWDGLGLPGEPARSIGPAAIEQGRQAVASFHLGLEALACIRGPLRHPGTAPEGLPEWAAAVVRFFLSDDRNFRPDEQVQRVRVLPPESASYLTACARLFMEINRCEDHYAATTGQAQWRERQRHRAVLAEAMRAWLLAACPSFETWKDFGALATFHRVPPLLFLAHLPPPDWPALAVYPKVALARLVKQTRIAQDAEHAALPTEKLAQWLRNLQRDCAPMRESATAALEALG